VQNKVAVGEKVELLFLAFAFASLVRGGIATTPLCGKVIATCT